MEDTRVAKIYKGANQGHQQSLNFKVNSTEIGCPKPVFKTRYYIILL